MQKGIKNLIMQQASGRLERDYHSPMSERAGVVYGNTFRDKAWSLDQDFLALMQAPVTLGM